MYKYLSVILAITLFSCHKPYEKKEEISGTVQNTEAKTLVVGEEITTPSGLKYIDEVIGSGTMPKSGDKVKVHYTGTLEDGTKFDSSRDRNQPFEFPLGVGRVIKGWDEGVATMLVGGKRKLIIPSELGYGPKETGPIPTNSILIFDIELLEVKEKYIAEVNTIKMGDPEDFTHFVNAGVYVFSPKALSYLSPDNPCDMPQFLKLLRDANLPVHAFPIHENWLDVGHPETLSQARR